ncbi:MAG: VIT1/CCC1 transporter family protein [Halanaeroarchaeum sp.]
MVGSDDPSPETARHENGDTLIPVSGNLLRAAVLGANDGLVSNLSLVMGVTGAALSRSAVVITGIAGLLAGAGSMAMGEWLSVQSSRELNQYLLEKEAEELRTRPDAEVAELAEIYERKGVPSETATAVAQSVMESEEKALETHAREELGIDPESLGGSAYVAAGASVLLFAVGAIVPLIPIVLVAGDLATILSLSVSTVALFFMGTTTTYLTGRHPIRSGLRQVAFGLGAAALIYGVGRLIGTTVVG